METTEVEHRSAALASHGIHKYGPDGSYVLPDASEFLLDGHAFVAAPVSSFAEGQASATAGEQASEYSGSLAGVLLIDGETYLVLALSNTPGEVPHGEDHGLCEKLTRRELQIAALVAKGKVNKQIAQQLNISEWTVSTHLRRIFVKLGVRSRAAMAAYVAAHFMSDHSPGFR